MSKQPSNIFGQKINMSDSSNQRTSPPKFKVPSYSQVEKASDTRNESSALANFRRLRQQQQEQDDQSTNVSTNASISTSSNVVSGGSSTSNQFNQSHRITPPQLPNNAHFQAGAPTVPSIPIRSSTSRDTNSSSSVNNTQNAARRNLTQFNPRAQPSNANTSTANQTPAQTQQPQQASTEYRAPMLTVIQVNPCQRGNGVLKYIRNVPWEYNEDAKADYQVGSTAGGLFLSLKYHRLHPEYIFNRMKTILHHYTLRLMFCLVDIDDHTDALRELNRVCALSNFTLILAWNNEELGRYIETFKAYEHKPPDMIKEKVDSDYLSRLTDTLTQIKSVNKTDVLTLTTNFGSLKRVIHANDSDIGLLPGFGEQKVRRLRDAWDAPFRLQKKSKRSTQSGPPKVPTPNRAVNSFIDGEERRNPPSRVTFEMFKTQSINEGKN